MKKLLSLILFCSLAICGFAQQLNLGGGGGGGGGIENCVDYNGEFGRTGILYMIDYTDHEDGGNHAFQDNYTFSCVYQATVPVPDCNVTAYSTSGVGSGVDSGTIDTPWTEHVLGWNYGNYDGSLGETSSAVFVFAGSVDSCQQNSGEPPDPLCAALSISFTYLTPHYSKQPGKPDGTPVFEPAVAVNSSYTCPFEQSTGNGSPIAFDLDGGDFGNAFTDLAHGVVWDFYGRGPGHDVHLSWTNPDRNIAWLALDRNNDGKINSAKELFGDLTWQPLSDQEEANLNADVKAGTVKPFKPNGFRALQVYDRPENGGNGDGKLDASDKIWSQLRLCVNKAQDAQMYTKNCQTMEQDGIKSINLTYTESNRVDQYGNKLKYVGTVEMINPSATVVKIYDVFPVFE